MRKVIPILTSKIFTFRSNNADLYNAGSDKKSSSFITRIGLFLALSVCAIFVAGAAKPLFMPPNPYLPPTVLEDMRKKEAEAINRWRYNEHPVRDARKPGESGNPVDGIIPASVTGTKRMPCVMMNFPDQTNTYSKANFQSMLFTKNGISTGSARDYFQEVSYGVFTLDGTVDGWYTTTNAKSYYGNTMSTSGKSTDCAYEAAQKADKAGFDWAPYDNDDDGYVDALWVVHSGLGAEESGDTKNDIWSHSWNFTSAGFKEFVTSTDWKGHTGEKLKINKYIIMPEVTGKTKSLVGIGVFCHEFGHTLGLPDLYDVAGTGNGLGNASLMAGGSWGGNGADSSTPAHLDAWCKIQLGWLTPTVIVSNGNYTLDSVETSKSCYLVKPVGSNINQYFLVENRQHTGFDSTLFATGMFIYHIDDDIIKNFSAKNEVNSNNGHPYGVALEEADATKNLYSAMNLYIKGGGRGSATDSWPNGLKNAFNGTSTPSSMTNSAQTQNCGITGIPVKSGSMTAYYYVSNTKPTVTITSPKGGEQWQQGSVHPITWTSTGNPANIKIDLYKAGVLNSVITASVANAGTFSWTVPAAQTIGTDYRVKISVVADATVTSQSAANFAVTKGAVVTSAPWPMFRHDSQHTGRSPYTGLANNKAKWTFATGSEIRSSPSIALDGTIYIGSDDKKLYAVNPDGTKKWEYTTGGIIRTSPAIASDGTIYLISPTDKKLYAINPDGTKKWEYTLIGNSSASPLVGADGTIYIVDDKVYAINPDGTKKWESVTTITTSISTPVISPDGTIYVGCNDYKLYAINPDGTQKWAFATNGEVWSSPAIATDGTIYVGSNDNYLYAINPDGTKKWSLYAADNVVSSPGIATDGTIYVGSEYSTIYAVNPDGTKKWSFYAGNKVNSSPAIGADGMIYIAGGVSEVYGLNPADGSPKWRFNVGPFVDNFNLASSPAIGADGTIYIGDYDGKLYAIGNSGTTPAITVTVPNGGEQWQQGTVHNITWTSTGITGNVKIDLYKTGVLNSVIAASVANSGTFSWTIPATQAVGTDYRVKISSVTDATITDSSNADFAITAGGTTTPVITVTSPNGGEQWQRGVAQTVTWISTAITGNVKIDLYKGGVLNSAIIASVANSGTYSWTIPAIQAIGTDYRVRISSVTDATLTDSSDANFEIASVVTTLGVPVQLSPANNAVNVNTPVTLAWQPVNTAVNYEYEVYSLASATVPIEVKTVNTTTAVIQYALAASTQYNWRVRAINASKVVSAYSPKWTFTTIAGKTGELTAPTLIAPADVAIDVPISATFTWTAVPSAIAYNIEISTDPAFNVSSVLSSVNTTVKKSLVNNTVYYWRVCAKKGNIVGPWSNVNSFTTVVFVTSTGVDAAIANSKIGSLLIGYGVINTTGAFQTVQIDQPINLQSEFVVMMKNTGNLPDNFIVSSNSVVGKKWKVSVFDISGINRTQQVFSGGWATYTVKSGETVKIMVRFAAVSGQVIDEANPPTQSINITSKSWKDITTGNPAPSSDTVTATAVLGKKTAL